MISSIMRSLLLILICALLTSGARILAECHDHVEALDRELQRPPSSARPTDEVIALPESSIDNVHRPGRPPPPPPQSASPHIPMIRENNIWTLKNYGRKGKAPPAPRDAPPTHQVSGGGWLAAFR